jgi:para-nitrobenzyl esterase
VRFPCLFGRAIVQSSSLAAGFGGGGPTTKLAQAEEGGKKLLAELGAPSIAALRSVPASEIMAKIGTRFGAFGLGPVIDGWLLPRDIPEAIAAGQLNNAELLIGATANEASQLFPPTTPETLRMTIAQRYGTGAEPIAALYTGTDADTATAAQDRIISDYAAATARMAARRSVKHGRPAWVYSFNRAAPGSDPVKVGAFHCAELVYVFGTQNTVERPWESTDRQLAGLMSSYWVRFAATGNPNGPNLPDWPAHDERSDYVKEFGVHANAALRLKSAPLLEAYLATRLSPR